LYGLCLQSIDHADDVVITTFVNEQLSKRNLPTYCSSDGLPQKMRWWNEVWRQLQQRDVALRTGLFFCLHMIIRQIPAGDDVTDVLGDHITTAITAERMTTGNIHHLRAYAKRAFLVLSLVKAESLERLRVSWSVIRTLSEEQCKALADRATYLDSRPAPEVDEVVRTINSFFFPKHSLNSFSIGG
jgi:hypothetical protein